MPLKVYRPDIRTCHGSLPASSSSSKNMFQSTDPKLLYICAEVP